MCGLVGGSVKISYAQLLDERSLEVAAFAPAEDKDLKAFLEEQECATVSDLETAIGCWEFNPFPEGNFQEEVVIEACVDDPGPTMTDGEWVVYDQTAGVVVRDRASYGRVAQGDEVRSFARGE